MEITEERVDTMNHSVITSKFKRSNSSNLKIKIVRLNKIPAVCCLKGTNIKYKEDKILNKIINLCNENIKQ